MPKPEPQPIQIQLLIPPITVNVTGGASDAQALLQQVLAGFTALKTTVEAKMAALDDELVQLETQVTANTDAEDSGTIVINKIPQMIADAVAAAIAARATPAQLQKITDLQTALKAHADPLAAAIAANTPAAP